jgi:hypothetical protein
MAGDPQSLAEKQQQEYGGYALRKVEPEAAEAGEAMGHHERGDPYQFNRLPQ